MLRNLFSLAAAVAALASCGDSPVAPLTLDGLYFAASVNGQSLPVRRIEIISNDAGTCEVDLDSAHLSLGTNAQFEMSISYVRACSGTPGSARSNVLVRGRYTRSGSDLDLATITSTDAVQRAVIRGEGVVIDIKRASGTQYQIRFEPVANQD